MQMLLHEIMHLSGRRAIAELRQYDMNPGQVGILMTLDQSDGISQSTLSKEMHIRPPSITMALRKMERQGLIVRTPDEKDQRMMCLKLTEAGRIQIRIVKQKIEELDAGLCAGMTEDEIRQLRCLLLKMKHNLEDGMDVYPEGRGGFHC